MKLWNKLNACVLIPRSIIVAVHSNGRYTLAHICHVNSTRPPLPASGLELFETYHTQDAWYVYCVILFFFFYISCHCDQAILDVTIVMIAGVDCILLPNVVNIRMRTGCLLQSFIHFSVRYIWTGRLENNMSESLLLSSWLVQHD